jgi:hypothetical protein
VDRREDPLLTEAGLPSTPNTSAITESATISFVTDPTHSIDNSNLPAALISTACITLIVGVLSASRPSSILPYMPLRCQRTRSQVTPTVSRCRCMMMLVERPVKSRRSEGARKV